MKYWCPECKSEMDSIRLYDDCCPICSGEESLEILPDFETPSQYEKRTGKKWRGAIWWRDKKIETHGFPWNINMWGLAEHYRDGGDTILLCAASPEPPPEDYVPEEKV